MKPFKLFLSLSTSRFFSKKLLLIGFLLIIYPAFILSYIWMQCFKSDFTGGKNGQLDAYRHTLASAVVAYTLSPKAVLVVTTIMERKGNIANLMDQHNNALGSEIGVDAKSLHELNSKVIDHIQHGAVNTSNRTQTTWLPKYFWGKSFFW